MGLNGLMLYSLRLWPNGYLCLRLATVYNLKKKSMTMISNAT